MQNTNKYLSSLDLKFLGAKFIAVNNTNDQLNKNLLELKRSKLEDLPSIFISSYKNE